MRAIMLAGGKGTRLLPYSVVFPKPLMPLDDMPILEIVLRQLKYYGFDHITITTGHLSELLVTFFGDGAKLGLKIDYSREDKPLGTAAPIALVEDLPETFLVMNGDILTTIDFSALVNSHLTHPKKPAITVATHQREVKIDLGVIIPDEHGMIQEYREKPTLSYRVCTGIYLCNRTILDYMPPGAYLDMPDLIRKLIAGPGVATFDARDTLWLDIGSHTDFQKAQEIFKSRRAEFLPGEAGTNKQGARA